MSLPDTLIIEPCPCGHSSCKRQQFINFGHFYSGTGFDPEEAAYLKAAYDFARRNQMTVEFMEDPNMVVVHTSDMDSDHRTARVNGRAEREREIKDWLWSRQYGGLAEAIEAGDADRG